MRVFCPHPVTGRGFSELAGICWALPAGGADLFYLPCLQVLGILDQGSLPWTSYVLYFSLLKVRLFADCYMNTLLISFKTRYLSLVLGFISHFSCGLPQFAHSLLHLWSPSLVHQTGISPCTLPLGMHEHINKSFLSTCLQGLQPHIHSSFPALHTQDSQWHPQFELFWVDVA